MALAHERYPSFPPHCRIKENLAVWSLGRWQYFNCDYLEPLPPSSVTIVNNGAVTANSSTPASGGTELTTFDVDEHQLLQLRIDVLEDIELVVWETQSQAKFAVRGVITRVSKMTRARDPFLETTEFNVLGRDRNAFIQAFNDGAYNIGEARFVPWGWKYILVPLRNIVEVPDATGIVRPMIQLYDDQGRPTSKVPLNTSYAVAEGRMS